jgi:hypothetical protein
LHIIKRNFGVKAILDKFLDDIPGLDEARNQERVRRILKLHRVKVKNISFAIYSSFQITCLNDVDPIWTFEKKFKTKYGNHWAYYWNLVELHVEQGRFKYLNQIVLDCMSNCSLSRTKVEELFG